MVHRFDGGFMNMKKFKLNIFFSFFIMLTLIFSSLNIVNSTIVLRNDYSSLSQSLNGEIGWHLKNIYVENAWNLAGDVEKITIAVIDSGIDFTHTELINSRWINEDEIIDNGLDDDGNGYIDDYMGWDFVSDDNNPGSDSNDPINSQGTFTAGIISASHNGEGIVGVAPGVKLMNIRLLDLSTLLSVVNKITDSIRYAVDNGADIISLSLQNLLNISLVYEGIRYAYENDVIMVSTSGFQFYEGIEGIDFPAAYEEVICVGAVNMTNSISDICNYGTAQELVAPVGDRNYVSIDHIITSTVPVDGYVSSYGSNFACPQVAGLIALMKSLHHKLDIEEIREILHLTATDLGEDGRDPYYGYGLINASKAMEETKNRWNKIVTQRNIIIISSLITTIGIITVTLSIRKRKK